MPTPIRESSGSTRGKRVVRKRHRVTLFDVLTKKSPGQPNEYVPLKFCRNYITQLRGSGHEVQLKLDLDEVLTSELRLSVRYLKQIGCDLRYLRTMYRFDVEEFEMINGLGRASCEIKKPRLILTP